MKEGEIEADVVAENGRVFEDGEHRLELIGEAWLAVDHGLGDAGEPSHAGGDSPFGVDKLLVARDRPAVLDADNANFNDFVPKRGGCAGGFSIDCRDREVAKRLKKGKGHSAEIVRRAAADLADSD